MKKEQIEKMLSNDRVATDKQVAYILKAYGLDKNQIAYWLHHRKYYLSDRLYHA